MSESLKAITCPHCGASLEPQDGIDTFFCQYCGGKIILTGLSDAAYRAKTRVKGIELIEHLQDKIFAERQRKESERQEMMRKQQEETKKNLPFIIALMVIPLLIPFIVLTVGTHSENKKIEHLQQIESQVGQAIQNEDYDTALFYANQLHLSSDWSKSNAEIWDEKREYYIKMIEERQKASK